MKKAVVLLALTLSFTIFGQRSKYHIPKYPHKLKMQTREIGTRPGTKASLRGPENDTYTRIYAYPAGVRLLVRAECGTELGRNELIQRAEKISEAKGPPVQIDWGTVRSERVSFWIVTYSVREILNIDLVAKDGKYAIQNKRKSNQDEWDVRKLTIDGNSCVVEKDLDERELRIAIFNVINQASLRNFRKGPGS